MKTIISDIRKEFCKKKIDWNQMEERMKSLGEKINFYDEDFGESILSELYGSCRKNGCDILKLTDLFVKYGFDVTANDGKNGASCLRGLCWSSYDKYILHIAEKLLDLGADSTISCDEDSEEDEEFQGVLGNISWKLGYWGTGEYDCANMFVAYYEMIDRQQKGKNYRGIRAFRDSVGEVVTKVEKLEVLGRENEVRTSYLLRCENCQLVVSDYVEFLIHPYAREEAISISDVSHEFRNIIGSKIRGLRYFNSTLAKLNFDNGFALLVWGNDFSEVAEPKAYVQLTASEQARLPEVGTPISSVKLWGGIRHAENSTYYAEHTVVFVTEEGDFGLYAHGEEQNAVQIRAERLDSVMVSSLRRSLDIHRGILKHIEYVNGTIKWISIQCDEGILYVVPDELFGLALFMNAFEVAHEQVLKIRSFTKGLEKIKFLR